MSEEERAEEYARGMTLYYESAHNRVPSQLDRYLKNAYLEGLHADRWHYPSKGELPTDDRRVLCKLRGGDDWYECGGYDKDNDTWSFESFNTVGDDVVAWQYIEPPKENA